MTGGRVSDFRNMLLTVISAERLLHEEAHFKGLVSPHSQETKAFVRDVGDSFYCGTEVR